MSARRFGLTGSERGRTRLHDWEILRARRARPVAMALVLLMLSSSMAFALTVFAHRDRYDPSSAKSASTLTLPIVLNWQHKDTVMQCVPDGPFCVPANGPHGWNDAKGLDGVYGSADDCPHCTCYCAPASISMIAVYRGRVGNFIQQDDIYDNGKVVGGETTGNGILETHGAGMFDGTGGWPTEVQASFQWSLGMIGYVEYNATNPINAVVLATQLALGYPFLWLDRDGWPVNQSASYPTPVYRADMGHARVIAGYDDNGTLADTSDDLCLIYDPWPEYTDKGIMPTNATQGPGGTFDPYWLPLADVLSDPADVFLRDNFPAIPEFQNVVLPILGSLMIAVALIRRKRTP